MTTVTPIRPEEQSDSAPPLRKRGRRRSDGDACLEEDANVDEEMAENESFLFGPSDAEQSAGAGGPWASEGSPGVAGEQDRRGLRPKHQARGRADRGGPGASPGPQEILKKLPESLKETGQIAKTEIHIALGRAQGEYLEP